MPLYACHSWRFFPERPLHNKCTCVGPACIVFKLKSPKGYPMPRTQINPHLIDNHLWARVWATWPHPKLDSAFGGSMFRPWCWIVSCHSIYFWAFSVMCRMPRYYLHKHPSDIYRTTAFLTYTKWKPSTLCPNWWKPKFHLSTFLFVMLYEHTIRHGCYPISSTSTYWVTIVKLCIAWLGMAHM